MTTNEQIGQRISGELHSTDASTRIELALWRPDRQKHILTEREQLRVLSAAIVTAAGGDCYFYFDQARIAHDEGALVKDDSANTFTPTGDWSKILEVGDTFYCYDATADNGEQTITALSYDPAANTTTITVASVTDGTDDGTFATTYFGPIEADASANTFTIGGDQRELFAVGRLFRVHGSTGNDNSDNNYTTTGASYDATANQTTISVASVADGTDDGYIIPQPTPLAGKYLLRGTYQANGGRVSDQLIEQLIYGEPGETLYCVAPAGVVDFEIRALKLANLVKTLPV